MGGRRSFVTRATSTVADLHKSSRRTGHGRGAVASASGLDEPIRNAKVHIDGDLALVWAEYQVRVNGAVSHCGYDAFQLIRRAGSWKILSIADTFRREGCGPMWPLK